MNGDDKKSSLFKHPNDIKKQDIHTLLLGENASLSDKLYLQSIINLTQSDEDKLLEFIVNYNKYQKKSKQGKQEQNNIMQNFMKLSKELTSNQDDKLESIGKEFKNLSQQNNNNLLNIDDDYNNQEKDIDMSNDKTNKNHDLMDDDDLWWLDEDEELIDSKVHDEFMNDNDNDDDDDDDEEGNDDEEDNEELDSEEDLEEELESEEQDKELDQEINELKKSDEEDDDIEEPEEYATKSEEDSEEEFEEYATKSEEEFANADSLDKDLDYLNSSKAVYDDYVDTDAKDDEDLWALNDQQISSNIFNEQARILPKPKIPNFLSTYDKNRLVNTKVHITVEAGSLDLTLDRLLTMQVGDIFEFAGLPAKVKLMANGSLLADGYLVEINGRIGVKIANLNIYDGNDDDAN